MKQNALITFVRHRWRNLERHRQNLLEEFDIEAVHQFRVEMKKLRAVICLWNAGRTEGGSLHITKKLHSFYQAVGEIRGLQIQRQTVVDLCRKLKCTVPHFYLTQLYKKEVEARSQARQEALQCSLSKFRHRLFTAAQQETDVSTVDNFISMKKHELLMLLAVGKHSEEQLHKFRKLLKDFLYVWPLIGNSIVGSFPEKWLTEQSCLSLTDKLGTFQDLHIAIAYFKACQKNVPVDECAVLTTLRLYCENQKGKRREQIAYQLSRLREETEKKDLLFKVYEII